MAGAVIGISTSLAQAKWENWHQEAAVVSHSYVRAVEEAGGVPFLIPTLRGEADSVVGKLDGLLLSGGTDIDPRLYGQEAHRLTRTGPMARDQWELKLVAAALAMGMPIFGICRGMQLINVALQGTLVQHLPDHVGTHTHRPVKNGFGQHRVRFAVESLVGRSLGTEIQMATHHHQAIDECGAGVEPVGWTDDGTIEAIEIGSHDFVVGLQGHPEESATGDLFAAFVKAAASFRDQALAVQAEA